MQQRALVIRSYGNQEIAQSVAVAMESSEIKKLRAELNEVRAQLGTRIPRDERYYQEKIIEARRKYKHKPIPRWKSRILVAIGLVMTLTGKA